MGLENVSVDRLVTTKKYNNDINSIKIPISKVYLYPVAISIEEITILTVS